MLDQIEAWETQTAEQQAAWLEKMDEYNAQILVLQTNYNAWKSTIDSWKALAVADLAQAVGFAFDNQYAYEGTTKTTTFGTNTITSVLGYPAIDKTLAERVTTFFENGNIETEETVYDTNDDIFRHVKALTEFTTNTVETEVTAL